MIPKSWILDGIRWVLGFQDTCKLGVAKNLGVHGEKIRTPFTGLLILLVTMGLDARRKPTFVGVRGVGLLRSSFGLKH
jgi:hypothetical protein